MKLMTSKNNIDTLKIAIAAKEADKSNLDYHIRQVV